MLDRTELRDTKGNETFFCVDGNLGGIQLVDWMNSHATEKITQAARVSYDKYEQDVDEIKDLRLIRYLARHKHMSPFRHSYISLYVCAPEFVARQWYKHVVGANYSFVDSPWNEVSMRYVELNDVFCPDVLHEQSENSKQGSGDPLLMSETLRSLMQESMRHAITTYQHLIANGVAKEEARIVLPLGMYTRFLWTASLQAVANFVKLRNSPDAQSEIRKYAESVNRICIEHFGDSWGILMSEMN